MSNGNRKRRGDSDDQGEDSSYLFTDDLSEPDPEDFYPKPVDLSSIDLDNLDEMALQLLSHSFDYCHVFVPTQLGHLKNSISIANKRLMAARSADDYVKVATASKVLAQSYASLLEQATVIFMSSYRPLHTLIQTSQLPKSGESVTTTSDETLNDNTVEDSEDSDDGDFGDNYKPYIDD